MRVAMYYNNKDIRLEEMPVPQIGRDELLVKVIASGICGSDVIEWYRVPKAPRVLGHEIAGEIAEVGEDVGDFEVGQRVFVSHHVPCMECRFCGRDQHTVCDTLRTTNFDPGGFAEYVRVPSINVKHGIFVLPDELTYEQGVFVEPLGCVIRGQNRIEGIEGGNVAILGSGLTGLLHLQLARSSGASRVACTDVSEYRLGLAHEFGADAAIPASEDVPTRLRELYDGLLADVVIVSTGARKAIEQSWDCVERGGSILLFAPTNPGTSIPMPFNELWFKGVAITSSYAASSDDIRRSIDLISSGQVRVQEMVTHELSLGETAKGFELVSKAGDSMKVIIRPHDQ